MATFVGSHRQERAGAADVAPGCVTLPRPLLREQREAGPGREHFGHKQGLTPPPS